MPDDLDSQILIGALVVVGALVVLVTLVVVSCAQVTDRPRAVCCDIGF